MFTAMKGSYNFADYANSTDLASAISGATLVAGDRVFFRFTKHLYGTVNAAGNAIVLATA